MVKGSLDGNSFDYRRNIKYDLEGIGKMNAEHKKIKNNHTFKRKNLKLLVHAYEYLEDSKTSAERGLELLDQIILHEKTQTRKEDENKE